MKSSELRRKLKDLAAEQGKPFRIESSRGRGSHAMLYFGTKLTVIVRASTEIGPQLLAKICRDLGLKSSDL